MKGYQKGHITVKNPKIKHTLMRTSEERLERIKEDVVGMQVVHDVSSYSNDFSLLFVFALMTIIADRI